MTRRLGELKPRRLERRAGRWVLTVETFVAVAPDIFVPTRYEVAGPDPIAATLAQLGEGEGLGRQARQVIGQFASGEGGEEISFEPRNGAWLPVAPEPALAPAPVPAEADEATAEERDRLAQRLWLLEQRFARVTEMERRIVRLQSLERRVARLEALLQGADAPAVAAALVAATRGAAGGSAPADDGHGPGARHEPAGAPPGGASGTGLAAPEAAAAGAAEAAKPAAPAVSLPSPRALERTLHILLGDNDLRLVEVEGGASQLSDEEGAYQAWLLSDDGDQVAAIVADLRATVGLGAKLMMIPVSVQKEHLSAGQASEEEVEAMSEVFNNLSGTINSIEGNPHVRTSAPEPLSIPPGHWAHQPARAVALDVRDGGRLYLLVRARVE